ncbi:MAG: glycosyltransferase family 4 protein [Bacteroidetes bacterium]|nr:glycosyltransferase family 4 protein [Bacteroidota bacterium]
MKIGIEGQRLFRPKKHGMDMVALELIRNLQTIDKENEYYIFIKPDKDNICLQETDNFHIIEIDGGSYPIWEQIYLPKAAKKYGCQLLHCTSNTAPIFCDIPLIITLHDIIYLESWSLFRKGFSMYQRFGNLYRRLLVPPALKNSKKIITVSNFEKERIRNFFGWPDNGHIVAIYNGVNDYFKPIYDDNVLSKVKKQYNLPDNFFFFLGNTDPKKNTIGVLKAYSYFVKKHGTTHKLVMLDYEKTALSDLLNEIRAPELIENIYLTGYVANTDLPAIYNQCDLFLYPSLRESFGIPMLEAMACGVPVITSNTSSMPEVSGDAAYLIDPYNYNDILSAMEDLLSNEKLRLKLREAGFKQAAKFSWNKMSVEILNLYREILVCK